MTPIVNLRILAKRFTQLSNSTYFDPAFRQFVQRTSEAINHVLANLSYYQEDVVRQFQTSLWRVSPFVIGSRTNDAPHETQFVLRKALNKWVGSPSPALISSASHDDLRFYFNPADDLWQVIGNLLDRFDSQGYQPLVVQIGFPEAFRHRPVFCVPLFHELGHFVDHHYRISETSIFVEKPSGCPVGVDAGTWQVITLNHRKEYFADLFASCHVGEATNRSLQAIAPNAQDTGTHPSTAKRVNVVQDFLNNKPNPHVQLIQKTLGLRGLPKLSVDFRLPDIAPQYDDVLTYHIADDKELNGIFCSAWDYLEQQINKRSAPWIDDSASEYTIEKIVNDLTEKSLRDFEVIERWTDVALNKDGV